MVRRSDRFIASSKLFNSVAATGLGKLLNTIATRRNEASRLAPD
ncbi:hypothetical protein RMSM_01334 [Rhodopirellula maiorica SM1]|uniref:Uncharacterized protein n=1 Tax=Rhodopirellula maiorica SM1 TaxID=1265738 RepID=M5S269_9BACT|nr:hypothetical protein RMSM_01334 [Rhodopirellula maiorica SM1]